MRTRSWLFVEGASEAALACAPASGADVLIQELEDFTAPEHRPAARALSAGVLERWRAAGAITCVRVNPLSGDGMADLAAIMPGRPDLVALPKVARAGHVRALDEAITALERAHGLTPGATGIVPNVESALGVVNTLEICRASPRVRACLVASEDMAADLGAERGRDALELEHVRARFHLECVAAGVLAIDCPYTWTDLEGLETETRFARRLGYRAKSAVHHAHAAVINRLLTPDGKSLGEAHRVVDAFEAARASGAGRVELDGSLLEVPTVLNARRLIARARELGVEEPGEQAGLGGANGRSGAG